VTVALTEPGVYDLPAAVYHRDPVQGGSLSSTGARKLLPPSCPALFRHYLENGQEPRREFDFGHAAHKVVLGAGEDTVVIAGSGKDESSWRTKADEEAVAAARAAGKTPITPRDAQIVDEMAAALQAHPIAGRLFDPGNGQPEQTLVWRDHEFGVWRRAMLDWLPTSRDGRRLIVADYKTTKSAQPQAISRALDTYGYAQQAAWYLDGVKALGLHARIDPAFVFVFQEKTAPYLVTVAQPDPDALLWGDRLNRLALHTYAQCTRTGRWPGYADDVISVGLPPWALRQHEDAWLAGAYDTNETSAA
jgi:hypothetical protein